jgi:hypothetical protein
MTWSAGGGDEAHYGEEYRFINLGNGEMKR